jgi:GGDEF domain-containing protein
MLKQRDAFEFQLQNSANTDSLTGVSNRLALDVYLKILRHKPSGFKS